jgi:hypothetical protein
VYLYNQTQGRFWSQQRGLSGVQAVIPGDPRPSGPTLVVF